MNYSKYGVSPNKEKGLNDIMKKLNIKETDIIERFIRSRGPGGQNVNKTSTCVYLKHLPSGVEIKCQKYRSQALNRFFARRILVKKIETILLGEKSQEQKRIYKLKKQKQKRSKRAKEKILRQKHILSEKKQARRSIKQSQYE